MILFQKDDDKSRTWAVHLERHGIETAAVRGSPIRAPFQLLALRLRGRRVQWYVFRYLNDYRSWPKTFVRLLSEAAVILLTRALGGRVAWIVHNVDRETSRHHPRLARVRRLLVTRSSAVVFVTDPLLIPRARQALPGAEEVRWVCFGPPETGPRNKDTDEVRAALRQLRSRFQGENRRRPVYIGLCVSSPELKCRHFITVCDFVERHTDARGAVGVVVVGDVNRFADPEFLDAVKRIRAHPGVLLIDRSATVREEHLKDEVDFIYRVMSDMSVPMTVYVAAAIGKPLVTEPRTFLEEMVSSYGLGIVAGDACGEESEAGAFQDQMDRWDRSAADHFLEIRNWVIAADQFARSFQAEQPLARTGKPRR